MYYCRLAGLNLLFSKICSFCHAFGFYKIRNLLSKISEKSGKKYIYRNCNIKVFLSQGAYLELHLRHLFAGSKYPINIFQLKNVFRGILLESRAGARAMS